MSDESLGSLFVSERAFLAVCPCVTEVFVV